MAAEQSRSTDAEAGPQLLEKCDRLAGKRVRPLRHGWARVHDLAIAQDLEPFRTVNRG